MPWTPAVQHWRNCATYLAEAPEDGPLTQQRYWAKHGHSMTGALTDPRHWRTVRNAHNQTGISLRTLYNWIEHGKLWSVKIDGVIFVHQHDLDVIKQQRERAA